MISNCLQHLGLKKGPPWLYLQVLRERMELICKLWEERETAKTLGSYHKEKFSEAVEWMDEVERFVAKTMELEKLPYQSLWTDSWCNDMISRIRKLRAKHEPYFTFQKGRYVVGLSLSLHDEFYCEVRALISVQSVDIGICHLIDIPRREAYKLNEDQYNQWSVIEEWCSEVHQFLLKIKLRLQGKIPETNFYWYRNKIAEARTLIAKHDQPFLLQSDEDVVGSSKMPLLVALHEELCCEIRMVISLKYADLVVMYYKSKRVPDLEHKLKKKLQVQIKEVNKFLTEIHLQLKEKIPKKSSDWYRNKIAETRTLIVTNYPAFPFPSQNVESTTLVDNEGTQNNVSPQSKIVRSALSIDMPRVEESKEPVHDVGYSKEQYQIFLSFRGEDTRHNFTSFLYHALLEKGFKIFMDEERLQIGDSISNVITAAIENSKLSIIIFSQNFADSTWCLDELVKILECRENKNQLIWPIFYKVDPSDVRHQRNSYKKAMIKQKTKFNKDPEKVNIWRSERDFIQGIVKVANNIRDHL
ncbi:uncharacterized protein LOC130733104 isoform X2 [Lotus japonicus]|uniref:uncharacterized protein LOC130733104 isoform X2 n=1 Tax=Lotus japonicus TaxID=34305 RepID=UPI0025853BBE|nr:uncharacterized protein LOC130733104 isoform X2 [Lotus japonicus]